MAYNWNRKQIIIEQWNFKSSKQSVTHFPKKLNRDSYVRIKISRSAALAYAKNLKNYAEKTGLNLNEEQLLDLAIVTQAAHEFGHGLEDALEADGRSSHESARYLGLLQDIPTSILSYVHAELFARAISEVVLRYFISEELGLSQEQIDGFFSWSQYQRNKKVQEYVSFLDDVRQKGYSLEDVIAIQEEIGWKVRYLFGEEYDLALWRVKDILAYGNPPYTEDQLYSLLLE